MRWSVFAVVAACSLAVDTSADAQSVPTRRIAVENRPTAVLELREVVRLGSLDGEHDSFGRVMAAALDRRGRIIVADDLRHRVAVFASDGRYVGQLGRRGRGPGEVESPWGVAADANDSIFVWDVAQARFSVFGPDLAFARSFRVPPGWVVNAIRFLPDGRLLLAAFARDVPGTLHILSRGGQIQQSFGPTSTAPDLAGFESSLLGGTADVHGDVIVYSTKSPYEIWFFDLGGEVVGRCSGRGEWTTSPDAVVETTSGGAALRWQRYVHSYRVVSLGGGLVMNQVLDPSGDRSFVDVLTRDCPLLRRTVLAPPTTIADRSGSRLVGVRSIEYPEVVVYEQRVRR